MIHICHLIWIVPLSAVAGVMLAFYIVIFDDAMWWANDRNGSLYWNEEEDEMKRKETEGSDNHGRD